MDDRAWTEEERKQILEYVRRESETARRQKEEEQRFWAWARWQPHIQPVTRWNMYR